MRNVRRFTEAVAHHRREIINAAEAAVAARLALQEDAASRDDAVRPREEGLDGMLFVPVRPAARGTA